MRENEMGPVGKIATAVLLALVAVSALVNIMRGHVPHPLAFIVVLVGFALFLIAKLSVVARKKWVSFGSGLMGSGMANLYRVGYWLMVVGVLVTFA